MKVYIYKNEKTEYIKDYAHAQDMGDMGLYCLPVETIEWASLHKESEGRAIICETANDYAVIELENILKIVD